MVNNLKKIISMLLCMALMFTSVGVFAEDAATEETVANPIEIDWEKIELLETLGIVDEIDETTAQEYLSEKISRAEFAVNIVKFANIENIISPGEGFKDVVKDSFEEPYIYTAVNMGLMAPVTEEYFYPIYGINYKEAAQALVMTLGYTNAVQHNNSWLIQAKKLGLMSGVDTGAVFTRMQAYKMLFNALHAEIMEITSISGGVADYVAREGIDALYKFFGIKHDEGIIKMAGGVELSAGKSRNFTEYIKQNGNIYKYGPHDLTQILGRNAVVYYDSSKNAICIIPKRNEELFLNTADILGYNNFVYTYGDDEKTARLSNPNIIRNGEEYFGEDTQAVMNPQSGSVTLVDNNNDGVYDIVFIESYTDHTVKLKLTHPDRIIGQFGEEESLSKDVYDIQIYTGDNDQITFDDITSGNVISIARAGSQLTVYVSTNVIEGSISQISKKLGKDVWRINGVDYNLSSTLKNALNAQSNPSAPEYGKISTARIGQNYKFYLNVFDEIVFYEEIAATDGNAPFYAIITAAKLEGISEDKLTVKVFAKDLGGFAKLTCAKRVMLNGSNATPQGVHTALNRDGIDGNFAGLGEIYPQPVKMKINESNEITYIGQASVRDYYTSIGRTLPAPPTNVTPDFILYMGDVGSSGMNIAYTKIMQYGMPRTQTTVDKWPYDSPSDSSKWFRQIGHSANEVTYQVPYYTNGSKVGRIAPEKEGYFKVSKMSTGTMNFFTYKEKEDSIVASLNLMVVGTLAGSGSWTPMTVGNSFNLHVVDEISREYINEAPVTSLKTNAGTYYIEDGKYNLDALPMYSTAGRTVRETDGTPKTYKVKPGDIVNITTDASNFITAIEAVYDHENEIMLGTNDNANIYDPTSPTIYAGRDLSRGYRLYKVDLKKREGDYIVGVVGDITQFTGPTASNRLFLTVTPANVVKVTKTRDGGVDVTTATGADYVGYDDSKTEYVTILMKKESSKILGGGFMYENGASN